MNKFLVVLGVALSLNANAFDFRGGVSLDTKQSDGLTTAYLEATENLGGLEFKIAFKSESIKFNTDKNQMPVLSAFSIGAEDGSFKFGRQVPKFGIHKTNFIEKSSVYNLTGDVADGLTHAGTVDSFNYSIFYSKEFVSFDANRDFNLGDFDFNLGGSMTDNGKQVMYLTANYGKFSLLAQGVRLKKLNTLKAHKVETVKMIANDPITSSKPYEEVINSYYNTGVSSRSFTTSFYKESSIRSYDKYYSIELSYAINKRTWVSYNTDNIINIGAMLTQDTQFNVEYLDGKYSAKIKYKF